LSLFGICLLAEWSQIIRAVWEVQPPVVLFFIFFVVLSTFGLMNVIIGVVVDETSQVAERSSQETISQQRKRQMKVIARLSEALFRVDANNDGYVTRSEADAAQFDAGLVDEILNADLPVGFTPADLYEMLDVVDDKKLTQAEFLTGIFRMIHSTEFQRMCMLQQSAGLIRRQLSRVEKQLEAMQNKSHDDLTRLRELLQKDMECMLERFFERVQLAAPSDDLVFHPASTSSKRRSRRKPRPRSPNLEEEQQQIQDVAKKVPSRHSEDSYSDSKRVGEGPAPRSGMLPSSCLQLRGLHMREPAAGPDLGALDTFAGACQIQTSSSQTSFPNSAQTIGNAKVECFPPPGSEACLGGAPVIQI